MSKDYESIRKTIRSGDLLAWSIRNVSSLDDIGSYIIRLFTKSEYNHVGMAWCMGDRIFVFEATKPHVRIIPLSLLSDFYWLPMNIKWSQALEQQMLSKIGQPYSVLEAISLYLGLPGQQRVWQCVKLVNAIYKEAGLNFNDPATPSDLVQRALEDPHTGQLSFIKL